MSDAQAPALPQRLALEGEMTIFTASALRERIAAALAAGDDIEIDLAQVSELDSAGVQLMLAARREADACGKTLRFAGHSPAVIATLDLCDLVGHFGDPVLVPRSGARKP